MMKAKEMVTDHWSVTKWSLMGIKGILLRRDESIAMSKKIIKIKTGNVPM